jgi:hypothetical protein
MMDNIARFPPFPRAVRPVPNPLALYLRPGRNDHREMLNLIATGDAACFGAVFDPTLVDRHAELRGRILDHQLDAILDPKTQQSATIGGYSDALGGLPWGIKARPHTLSDFEGTSGQRAVAALGDFVLEHRFTQVIAPTHLLRTASDPWVAVDAEATRCLRNHLDRNGGSTVSIIYSLAIPYGVFRDKEERGRLIGMLGTIPFEVLWLKIDGFGSLSSPTATLTYIEAAADFHSLGLPVVADHVGGAVGLSLLAFGAVGGIAHGITLGERFDGGPLRRQRIGKAFGPKRRVYLPAIDLMLTPSEAESLINRSSRTRAQFACNDSSCCPRGMKDMLENPGRHFLYQRIQELSALSQMPDQLRPQRFLDQHLRPASDKAVAAAGINWEDNGMAKKMQLNRKRLDALRIALGAHADRHPPRSIAALPKTRVKRNGRQ